MFTRGLVPLTKLTFMRLTLLCAAFLLSGITSSGQHPWSTILRNSAADLHYTLQLEKNDSVCIRPFQAENLADTTVQAINRYFAVMLEREQPELIPQPMCTNTTGIFVTGKAAGDEERIRLQLDAMNGDLTWSAVFFLEGDVSLPEIGNPETAFDRNYFEVPELPAEATLLRMSGNEIRGSVISVDGIDIVMETPRKRRKPKRLELHKSEVFSLNFHDRQSGEWVPYAPDPVLGDDLTVDEMRIFIAGEQDARRGFKVWPTTLGGFLVGAGSAILADGGLLFTIVPPLAYSAFPLLPVIRIQGASISRPEHKFNEVYALGYERVARPKKLVGAMKGTGLGLLVGIATYFVFLR